MNVKFSFPVFLSLQNKHCLVVGFGNVGRRKLRNILSADPRSVLVLDLKSQSMLNECGKELLADERILFENRSCTKEDIKESFLVFAATNFRHENERIANLCKVEGVLCNSASDPENGSFIIPAQIEVNDISLAMSTSGASPALAKKWLNEQKNWLEGKSLFAVFLRNFRKAVLEEKQDSQINSIYLHNIVASSFEEWFISGKIEQCTDWLKQELPTDLYNKVKEILYDFS